MRFTRLTGSNLPLSRLAVGLAAVSSLVLLSAGCAHKSQSAAVVPPTTPPPAVHAAPPPAPAPAPAPQAAPAVTARDFADVYFDFDSAALRADGQTALNGNARLMRDHPAIKVRVEGHCDERGTIEYNQALGERRAQAVRDYLVNAGVAAASVETISYGKEQPFCEEHNEACWQKNRCTHFALLSTPAVN